MVQRPTSENASGFCWKWYEQSKLKWSRSRVKCKESEFFLHELQYTYYNVRSNPLGCHLKRCFMLQNLTFCAKEREQHKFKKAPHTVLCNAPSALQLVKCSFPICPWGAYKSYLNFIFLRAYWPAIVSRE